MIMAKNLISGTVYQTMEMAFPSAKKNDGVLRALFTLDTKNGIAISLSGGGIFKGDSYIGSFDGFVGFTHNVVNEDKEAVDTLLEELSETLTEAFGVPAVPKNIENNEIAE